MGNTQAQRNEANYISVWSIVALLEDSSTKAADRAKLKGYLKKWLDAKYLLGCAFFVDLLLPCSVVSMTMQSDEVDIVGAMSSLLRTVKEVDKLCSYGLERWPTYAATLAKITEEDGKHVYQLQELKCFAQVKEHFTANFNEFCASVTTCFRTRLAWSDLQLIRDIIFVMETQGWQKIWDDESEVGIGSEDISLPVTRLAEIFRVPLDAAGVKLDLLPEEFKEILLRATQFISLSTLGYQAVWWRLFHAPNCNDWPNLLLLVHMLFTQMVNWKGSYPL